MKKSKIKNDDISESLIKSILFFIFGIILAANPSQVVSIALYIISCIFFILGVIKLLVYFNNPLIKNACLTGIIYMIFSIAIAIFAYAFMDIVEVVLRYTIAAFFLYTGIVRIIKAFTKGNKARKVYLINALIMLVAAVLVAIISNLPLRLLGVIICLYGAVEITSYVFYKKETKEEIKEAKIVEKENT